MEAHEGVNMRKSEKHLVEWKGSWYTMEIQGDRVIISIFVIYNIFYCIIEYFLSFVEVVMIGWTKIKISCTFCVVCFIFYVISLICLHWRFWWHSKWYQSMSWKISRKALVEDASNLIWRFWDEQRD